MIKFAGSEKMTENINGYSRVCKDIIFQVKKVIKDKDFAIIKSLMAILAGGHILIEDVPGVGKTSLALAFSRAMELDYKRLQFTTDVLPSDVLGFSMFNKQTGKFEYKKGAAICNLFLADEINRTSSKTQSALLEIMEEGNITIDGQTYEMPKPYIVMATQNPIGSVGTQLLPESQLDRFIIRLSMGYPDKRSEIEILKGRMTDNPLDSVDMVVNAAEIVKLQDAVSQVYISDAVYEYIVDLSQETRNNPMIKLGLSPRGSIALMRMSKACAFIYGRNYVTPEDVAGVFSDVVSHRLLLSTKSKSTEKNMNMVIKEILNTVPVRKVTNRERR